MGFVQTFSEKFNLSLHYLLLGSSAGTTEAGARSSTGSLVLRTETRSSHPCCTHCSDREGNWETAQLHYKKPCYTSPTALIPVTNAKSELYVLLLSLPFSDCPLRPSVICLDLQYIKILAPPLWALSHLSNLLKIYQHIIHMVIQYVTIYFPG